MITFIRLVTNKDGFITYEYGRDKNNMIGTVTTEISNPDNVTYDFYDFSAIKKFCTSTAHTITLVFRFIKESNFPTEYTYAC